jgi:tetratricopeptide (TPR) repeat protein
LIDSIFKTEPLADRIAMNNATITNTMNSAIANKSYTRAMAAANFTRSSWSGNPIEGQKNWSLKIMQYYKGVKDTTKYLQQASGFYEQHYMRLTVDSVRKRDSLNYITARKNAKEIARTIINDTTIKRTFSFSYTKDRYATELNNAAWTFYQMAANKNDYLFKAMLWSRRSIELSPKPAFYDTYAHLLYRLKFFDEAESMQRKAIELGKADKIDTKLLQEEYEKIRKKTL